MILGRLLEALFARGVIFVMTSNYPPDGLYPNGLQRINFLPTIVLLKQRFDVIEVDYGTDYRLRTLEQLEKYLVPDDADARKRMGEDFFQIAALAALECIDELEANRAVYAQNRQLMLESYNFV